MRKGGSTDKLKQESNDRTEQMYKKTEYEDVWIIREEAMNFGRDMEDKCMEEPKLIYRIISDN